ncbi:MAG: cell division protein ZipA [Dokdonella sp.]
METPPVLSTFELRVIIGVIGLIVMALIFFLGSPRKKKAVTTGRRTMLRLDDELPNGRFEPSLGDPDAEPAQSGFDIDDDDDLPVERFGSAQGDDDLPEMHVDEPPRRASSPSVPSRPSRHEPAPVPVARASTRSTLGVRPTGAIDRIVTLYVSARAGETFNGSDLVVAAEKAGLQFGDMNIFHRMAPGKFEKGPVFSMATMTKPGNFDMKQIAQLATPGITLFMTLPGPMSALDAWDTMLPTAQRIAELLDGVVLDEQRHILGRQRIAHLRDELRGWDRGQERQQIKPSW